MIPPVFLKSFPARASCMPRAGTPLLAPAPALPWWIREGGPVKVALCAQGADPLRPQKTREAPEDPGPFLRERREREMGRWEPWGRRQPPARNRPGCQGRKDGRQTGRWFPAAPG